MRRTISILFLLLFIISCNTGEKNSKNSDGDSGELNGKSTANKPIALPVNNSTEGDPSFVLPKDTISLYGPGSITRNILQDENGNYWFATWEGVICYDGKFFTNITLKKGLRQFHIFSILEDRKKNLWFGTIRGGVYRYELSPSLNAGSNSFTNFTTAEGLVSNVITCMLEDTYGNIWFGTDGGVSRFDGKTFTNFTVQDGLPNNFISSIIQNRKGKICIGTDGGVCCYDPSASTLPGGKSFTNVKNEKGLNFYRVRSMVADNSGSNRNGKIWIGSADGLYLYDPVLTTSEKLSPGFINSVYYVFQDKQGDLWLSCDELNSSQMTLFRYDGKSFTKIRTDKQIFGITGDRDDNIWFGTANGVFRYDPSASLTNKKESFNNFLE